jgi:tetratricopeptide (TPR) repeat protein
MKDRSLTWGVEQSESKTNLPQATQLAIGNVTEIATSKCRVATHRSFVHQAAWRAVMLLLLLATPLCAQNVNLFGGSGEPHPPSVPLIGVSGHLPTPQVIEDEVCLPWAVSAVRGATVSVMRLQVPSKARREFEKACGDLKRRKLSDATQHARTAVEAYPHYVAAWVMLGQALEGLQETEEARDACSRALSADPTYLPPYLCLAEISARNQEWDAVLNLTDRVIGLNRVGDVYTYFYRTMALYQLHRMGEAEKSALDTASINADRNIEARVSFLLTQIYEAEGQLDAAAAQLRRFMKLSTDRNELTVAERYLARLEGQQATK